MPHRTFKITHKEEEIGVIQRLHLLQLAEELGNVSEACRQSGIDRSRFYTWKKRYEKWGLEGLRPRGRKPKKHPTAIKENIKRGVIETALKHPQLGCNKLASLFEKQKTIISAASIYRILVKQKLETREKRALHLYSLSQGIVSVLSEEQNSFLSMYFPER